MKILEYRAKEKAIDRSVEQKYVWVCEFCGDISDKDSEHAHYTSYVDGSYHYYMPRVKYKLTLDKIVPEAEHPFNI